MSSSDGVIDIWVYDDTVGTGYDESKLIIL